MEKSSPIGISDNQEAVGSVDVEWLAKSLGLPVATVQLEPFENAGGLYAVLQKVTPRDAAGNVLAKLVVKSLLGVRLVTSKTIGAAREANFYNELAPSGKFPPIFPKVVYAFGDMVSGVKVILMQDASDGIHSGYFFGYGSPINATVDLEEMIKPAPRTTVKHICSLAAVCAAKFQAVYWAETSKLSSMEWLRGSDWVEGNGRDGWEASQNFAKTYWEKAMARRDGGESSINWNSDVLDLVNASLGKISWEEFQERMRRFPLTLVHGDFHPGNMMYMHEEDKLIVLDWELVGIGSGPQDVGQYMISHASPDARRACESDIMSLYHSTLLESGVEVGLESCMAEYAKGGLERFIWLFVVIAGGHPDGTVKFFHDQILAFMKDHNITPSTVGQPRA